MEEGNINGYVLNKNSHENYKRAMLFHVFDVLDVDLFEEVKRYERYRGRYSKEKQHDGNALSSWFLIPGVVIKDCLKLCHLLQRQRIFRRFY